MRSAGDEHRSQVHRLEEMNQELALGLGSASAPSVPAVDEGAFMLRAANAPESPPPSEAMPNTTISRVPEIHPRAERTVHLLE